MVDICLSAIIPIKTLNLNLKLKYRSLHESHNPSPVNCSGYRNKRRNRKRYVSVIDWNLAAPICDLILEQLINFIFGFHYIAHKNFSETHSLCCSYPFSFSLSGTPEKITTIMAVEIAAMNARYLIAVCEDDGR